MENIGYKFKNWLAFLLSVILITLVAVLGLLIWNTQAASPGPSGVEPFVHLNLMAGEPGTVVAVSGRGWQVGEPVQVYLVEYFEHQGAAMIQF